MKVVYSSMILLFVGKGFSKISKKLTYLPFIHFLVATAFRSDEVQHPRQVEFESTRDAQFFKLMREITDALKAEKKCEANAVFFKLTRELIDELKSEKKGENNYGGAHYVRWGRNVCPSGSDVIYKGVAGGSWWDAYGGGSNYLCLPLDPIWGAYSEDAVKYSQLYGAEYEHVSVFGLNNNQNRPLHNNNVPCIVCRSQTKTSVIMIPARNKCYNGWRTEYTGYLVSMSHLHKGRTEFVCMDGQPESDPSGYRDENGALFYNVEGVCGSLPCPPYAPKRELTCAVCTK